MRLSFHLRCARRGFVRFFGAVAPADPGVQVGFQLLRPPKPVNEGGTIVHLGRQRWGVSAVACACVTVGSTVRW